MNTKSKHILFLPRWYPHQFDPMFGLFVQKHAEAVAKFHHVSVLYVQGLSSIEEFEKEQVIETPSLYTHIYYYQNSSCRIWNVLRFWYYLVIGFLNIKRERGKPNLVHVHILTRLGIFALLLKTIYSIPYIITEHWSRYLPIPNTYKGCLRKKLGRTVTKNAKAILPVSTNLAEAMQKHGLTNSNYQVVANVVDDLFFQSLQKKEPKNKITFLHVSTFEDRSKNISGILRSIKKLSEKTRDFEFWLVGDGIDYDILRTYSEELEIPKELIWLYGLQQGQNLVDLYHQADFLVLFSNFENIPVVINEAQACGLPVIATEVGGISEVINAENGFLIAPKDEEQLTTLLAQVIAEDYTFNAVDIQQNARSKYSFDAVGEQLNRIYKASF